MLLALFMYALAVRAEDDGEFVRAVLMLSGCSDAEELDESEVERYSGYYENPLRLNYATVSQLLSSGLMSAYQVAVLADYRQRSGDILSFEELSALDGFGYSFVSALRCFVSLDSSSAPGRTSLPPHYVRNSLTLRSGIRNTDALLLPEGMYAAKYRVTVNDRFEAGLSFRSSWQDSHFPPEKHSFFAACYGRKLPGKIIVGDYSLRFGQGLALWPGFSMSGIGAPESFARRPSGIVPYNSYSGTGAFRGVAADVSIGHFCLSAFVSGLGLREAMEGKEDSLQDVFYGMNAGWYGMAGQVSVTCYAVSPLVIEVAEGHENDVLPVSGYFSAAKLSGDARISVHGTDFFGEVSYDIREGFPAALAGLSAGISDAVRLASMIRYYPPGYSSDYSGAVRSGSKCSNEYGISAALSYSAGKWMDIAGKTGFGSSRKRFQGTVSIDAGYSPEPKFGVDTSSFQIKLLVSESMRLSRFFGLDFRLSGRYRTYGRPFRTDVRADLKYSFTGWNVNLRLNILHCRDISCLSYLEGGYKAGRWSAWLRSGVFRVDNWDDRIYAYERDAPGNFSVPAYYGRGYWLALTAGWRLSRGLKFYLRGSFQDYPWLRPSETYRKPAKAEIKLQLVADIYSSAARRRSPET